MSYDAYAIHLYGIETDALDRYHIKNNIEKELEGDYDDLYYHLNNGETLDSLHYEKYPDLEFIPTAGSLYGIGFSIQAPWDMDITDQNEMNRQIQAFLEDVYKDMPENFAEKHADEIYYAWIGD